MTGPSRIDPTSVRVARLRPGDGVSVDALVEAMPEDWSRPFCGFARFFELCRASTCRDLPTAYVASVDGVGVATINVVDYDDFPEAGPWLANGLVLASHRGLGLWRLVRSLAIADAAAMGLPRLLTYTSSPKVAAVSRDTGWRHLGRRTRGGGEVDVFELVLPPRTFVAVFGSLRRGQPNARLLADPVRCRWVGTGTIAGSLYELPADRRDAAAGYPYPLYVPGRAGRVVVDVVEVVDPALLGTLDDLESLAPDVPEYVRVLTPVHVPGHPDVDRAWVYDYAQPRPAGLRLVPSGDWAAHTDEGAHATGS